MASVLDHHGKEIALADCPCGAEPNYISATGVVHIIKCPLCLRQTDLEMAGLDAVHEWNIGRTYASAKDAPLASKYLSPSQTREK